MSGRLPVGGYSPSLSEIESIYLQETSSTAVAEFAWSKSGGWSSSCNALPPA